MKTANKILGEYIDGTFVNKRGIQICERCGSENITDPISEDCLNGICNHCGFHWNSLTNK